MNFLKEIQDFISDKIKKYSKTIHMTMLTGSIASSSSQAAAERFRIAQQWLKEDTEPLTDSNQATNSTDRDDSVLNRVRNRTITISASDS